jgi:hypothetical protein
VGGGGWSPSQRHPLFYTTHLSDDVVDLCSRDAQLVSGGTPRPLRAHAGPGGGSAGTRRPCCEKLRLAPQSQYARHHVIIVKEEDWRVRRARGLLQQGMGAAERGSSPASAHSFAVASVSAML